MRLWQLLITTSMYDERTGEAVGCSTVVAQFADKAAAEESITRMKDAERTTKVYYHVVKLYAD